MVPRSLPLPSLPRAVAALAVALGLAVPGLAQATWTGTASTAWDDPANWSTGAVPTQTTDVLVPATANQPLVGPAIARVRDLAVLETAVVTTSGTGTVEVHGDLTLVASALGTGSVSLGPAGADLRLFGTLTQDDASALQSGGGRVLFEAGSSLAGTALRLPAASLVAGTTTLLAEAEVLDLDVTGGTSAGAFPWVFADPGATALSGSATPLHHVRVDAGTVTITDGSVADLTLAGGTLNLAAFATPTVSGTLDAQAGAVTFENLNSQLTVTGDVIAGAGVAWADGFVNMEGTTTITGPGGGTGHMRFVNFKSGLCTLLTPLRIDGWVGASGGGAAAGEWIEVEGGATLSQGLLARVRVVGGNVKAFGFTIDELEVTGGTLELVAGTTSKVVSTGTFTGGAVAWLGAGSGKLEVQGALVADAGVTWGDGYVRMTGTTTISGTGGAPAWVGGVELASGTCDLLADANVQVGLRTAGGTSTGAWFVAVGAAVDLHDSIFASTAVHRLRVDGGVATVAGPLQVDELELTGGVLRLPPGATMSVNVDAELLAGELEFEDTGATTARLDVLGDLRQVATAGATAMSPQGELVCHGTWTADGPSDLGLAFVVLEDGASVTGAAPTFGRLRLADDATVSLLDKVVVTGRLENAGGTSQGLWFELVDDGVELATAAGTTHDLRIAAGRTVVDGATVSDLTLTAGELVVDDLETLTVTGSLDLAGGSLTLDPDDTGVVAKVLVEGDVTWSAAASGLTSGAGGVLRCEGLWFGDGACDLGAGFAELGGGATVLGTAASFRRLRVEDGAVSLNTTTVVTEELVVEADATVLGLSPFEARPGPTGTLTLSGGGNVAELQLPEGTVDMQGGGAALLRVTGGTLRVTGTATGTDLSLEAGLVELVEGASLDLAGDLDLTAGTLDVVAGDGSQARLEVGGTLTAAGTLPGPTLLATGTLATAGGWQGTAPLDLGDVQVEVGGPAGSPTSLAGPALTFGRLRVTGEADLVDPVTVTTRLEGVEGAATSGDWFRLDGATTELAVAAGSLHRVRQVAGVLRAFDATVGELELAGGELVVDAGARVTVTTWLELLAGSLSFDPAARLEAEGVLHQVATAPGATSHADAALAAAGEARLDATLDLGSAALELLPGSRVTGAAAATTRLVVPLVSSVLPPAAVEVPTAVTGELTLAAGAELAVSAGSLTLAGPPVSLDGRLSVGPGADLLLDPATAVTLGPTGALALFGIAGLPAEVRAPSGAAAGGWDLTIDGTLEGRWFGLHDIGSLVLGPGAALGSKGLVAGVLERGTGVGPGPLLVLGVPGAFDLIGLDFEGGPGDTNVLRAPAAGVDQVTLRAWGGGLGGETFEDDAAQGAGDPDGLLAWVNTTEPDLLPLELEGDAEAVIGWTLRVDYAAVNQGGGTAVAPWVDRLWLTPNPTLGDGDDVGLAKFTRAADVPAGEPWTAGADLVVPVVDEGTWYLAMRLDNGEVVPEGADAGDNVIVSAPFEVFATPRPNLVAQVLDGPTAATDGDTVEVTWTVANLGLGATDEATGTGGTWEDRVYLSEDGAFGGDTLLASFPITAGDQPGGIAPGGSYTETREVTLPLGISGPHRLVVRADALDEVTPEAYEDDNLLVAPTTLDVTQTDLPDLVGAFDPVTSPLGDLFAGAPADLAWTVTNADPEGDGLGGADGTLRQRLVWSLDPVLDAGDAPLLEETVAVSLAPLEDVTSSAAVTLPATPGTWWVIGELDVDDAVAESDEANNVWIRQLAIVAPGHEGSVATTFTEGLASQGPGDLVVPLTGQSTVPGSIQLVPDADLTIRVRRGDTRRVFDVTTDALGAYAFDFEPLVGEAGTFDVFCDHPSVAEDPLLPQASFVLHDLAVTPTSLSASLVTGETRLLALGLANPGDQPLTGLTLTPVGLPAHLAIRSVSLPPSLAAGAADLATFELVAVADAPDPPGPTAPAAVTLDLGFDLAGAPTVARTVALDVWVTPTVPDPVVVGLAPSVQVAGDGRTRVVLELWNRGGAPLTNASFALESAADRGLACPTQEPFVPAVPTDLGDVGPDEARLLAFDLLAGACADLGPGVVLVGYTVTVTADQGSWAFPVDLSLVASPLTTLTVRAQDAGSWWSTAGAPLGGAGPKPFGALVTATDRTGAVVSTTTNFAGTAVLSGLTPGLVDLVVEPPAATGPATHVPWRAPVRVLVGQDTEVTAYLPAAPPALTATATTATDGSLDLALATTSPAGAAAGRLEVTAGQLLDLDLAVGQTGQFQVDLAHAGGAPVRGVELVAPDLPDYDVEPAFLVLGDLEAGQTTSVVLTITRTGGGDPCALALAGDAASHGLRWRVDADEPVWHWTPLLLQAPELAGPCAPALVGGPAPLGLPAPVALPPAGDLTLPPPAPYLGAGRVGTWSRPVAPLPAGLVLPL